MTESCRIIIGAVANDNKRRPQSHLRNVTLSRALCDRERCFTRPSCEVSTRKTALYLILTFPVIVHLSVYTHLKDVTSYNHRKRYDLASIQVTHYTRFPYPRFRISAVLFQYYDEHQNSIRIQILKLITWVKPCPGLPGNVMQMISLASKNSGTSLTSK
jgi:hypothetical protein